MANQNHFALVKEGIDAWNQWREENPETQPDLCGADLQDADLKKCMYEEVVLVKLVI